MAVVSLQHGHISQRGMAGIAESAWSGSHPFGDQIGSILVGTQRRLDHLAALGWDLQVPQEEAAHIRRALSPS